MRWFRTKEGYLTTTQFAEKHNVTMKTVSRWVREGRVNAIQEEGIYWIPENEKIDRSFTSREAQERARNEK